MNHFDEFSRPEEYISPFDKHFRRVIRKTLDECVMPHRRKFDEDWKDHHLIEPAFDKLMGEIGLQKGLFPLEYGGWGLAKSDYIFRFGYHGLRRTGQGRYRHGSSPWGNLLAAARHHRLNPM